jgi:hypothetical protein
MSKYHLGDKFIVDVKEVLESNNGTLYRSNFSTLVFDDYGLDKLQKYDEIGHKLELIDELKQAEYNRGLADAWELARKIVCAKGFNMDELDVIFGERTADGVLKKYTVEEALAKIEAYEKEKGIKVGDEVRTEDGSTYWIIAINDYCIFGYASGKNDICFPVQKLEGLNLTKTGRTTDAIDLLRQIGE